MVVPRNGFVLLLDRWTGLHARLVEFDLLLDLILLSCLFLDVDVMLIDLRPQALNLCRLRRSLPARLDLYESARLAAFSNLLLQDRYVILNFVHVRIVVRVLGLQHRELTL